MSIHASASITPSTRPSRNRRRFAKALLSLHELEPRTLLSLTATFLVGPQNAGDVFVYAINSGSATGTLTETLSSPVAYDGFSNTTQVQNNLQFTNANASTTQAYYGFDSNGNDVFYGSTSNTTTITVPNPGIVHPASMTGGITYTESFVENYANGYMPTITHKVKLLSETPSNVTVGAGTFLAYELDDTITTSGNSVSVFEQHFLVPGLGEVKLTRKLSGISTLSTYSLTSASGPGVVFPSTNKLAFTTQPTGTTFNTTLSPVVIHIEDANGTLLTSDNSNVTLSLSGSATLGGTTTVAAVNGIATFSNLTIPSAGNYTLSATDGALQTATSHAFNITGGPGSVLVLTTAADTLPAHVVAGAASTAKITFLLINVSDAPDSGTAVVSLYATQNGTIDSTSTLLGTGSKTGTLAAGAHVPITVNVTSIPSNLLGTYTLAAKVTDTSSNTDAISLLTSLTVDAPTITFSETVLSGGSNTFSNQSTKSILKLLVVNNGNIQSTGNSSISLFESPGQTPANGTLIRTVSLPISLKPGAHTTLSIPLNFIPPVANGVYFLVAQVTDSQSHITSAASSACFTLTAPVINLSLSNNSLVTAKNGSGKLSFNLTQTGNINFSGNITVNLSFSDGSGGFTPYLTTDVPVKLTPSKPFKITLALTASQLSNLTNATPDLLDVDDLLGQTAQLTLNL